MIRQEIINRLSVGTVAIGYTQSDLLTSLHPKNIKYPDWIIIGTGFFVDKNIVITNRHVIVGLLDVLKKGIKKNQLVISFVSVEKEQAISENEMHAFSFLRIKFCTYAKNPRLDIGFVELFDLPDFRVPPPLQVTNDLKVNVGDPVGIYGYPYGIELLKLDNEMFRFGPILQQGYISAIAPFSNDPCGSITKLLLDVRTAPGMSGGPVFLPSNGNIIGINYAGAEATVALALPINNKVLSGWLEQHKKEINLGEIYPK